MATGFEQLEPGQFYGAIDGRRRCGGVLLSELVHVNERILPAHAHGHPYVSLLCGGSYRESWGRERRREVWYEPFTAVYHPEGFCHDDAIGPGGARFFSVEMPRADFEAAAGLAGGPADVRRDVVHGRLSRAAVRLFTSHRLGEPLAIPVAEFVGELASGFERSRDAEERSRPGWLSRVNEALRERCGAEEITLRWLAGIAGVHPVHLSRTFERYEGCSISERVRALRVQRAMRGIAEGRWGLAEAAAHCGFADQAHLTRVFRQANGVTPGRFRQAVGRVPGSRAEVRVRPSTA